MAIIYQHDKRSGITYAYDSKSYYDKEKKCSRAKRTLIGRVDPETGEIVPTDGRNKGAKSKPSEHSSPDIDKDKRIQELENENRQLKLQISALKKNLNVLTNRFNNHFRRNGWTKPLRVCSLRMKKKIWKDGFVISKIQLKLWSVVKEKLPMHAR